MRFHTPPPGGKSKCHITLALFSLLIFLSLIVVNELLQSSVGGLVRVDRLRRMLAGRRVGLGLELAALLFGALSLQVGEEDGRVGLLVGHLEAGWETRARDAGLKSVTSVESGCDTGDEKKSDRDDGY